MKDIHYEDIELITILCKFKDDDNVYELQGDFANYRELVEFAKSRKLPKSQKPIEGITLKLRAQP